MRRVAHTRPAHKNVDGSALEMAPAAYLSRVCSTWLVVAGHPGCFRCAHCDLPLKASDFSFAGTKAYCRTHFKQLVHSWASSPPPVSSHPWRRPTPASRVVQARAATAWPLRATRAPNASRVWQFAEKGNYDFAEAEEDIRARSDSHAATAAASEVAESAIASAISSSAKTKAAAAVSSRSSLSSPSSPVSPSTPLRARAPSFTLQSGAAPALPIEPFERIRIPWALVRWRKRARATLARRRATTTESTTSAIAVANACAGTAAATAGVEAGDDEDEDEGQCYVYGDLEIPFAVEESWLRVRDIEEEQNWMLVSYSNERDTLIEVVGEGSGGLAECLAHTSTDRVVRRASSRAASLPPLAHVGCHVLVGLPPLCTGLPPG